MKSKDISSHQDAERLKYKRIVKTIPEVRKGKVEAIRRQIKAGKYKVPAESVARSIAELHHTLMPNKNDESEMSDE